jgi:5'-methylthioadenosine phosphorylase
VAQQAIQLLVDQLQDDDCACQHALSQALITQRDRIPAETRKKLDLLVGKYLEP